MRAIIQRVKRASVTKDDATVSEIGQGLLVFLGVEKDDGQPDLDNLVRKIPNLRIFEDCYGKMNLSVKDIEGSIIIVSQFTIMGSLKKGYRPSFDKAMEPETANRMYEELVAKVREQSGLEVYTGVFGADMQVELLNDGPCTILLDSRRIW